MTFASHSFAAFVKIMHGRSSVVIVLAGFLGVRFIYVPRDIVKLRSIFKDSFDAAVKTCSSSPKVKLSLWPQNLCDYLGKIIRILQ